MARRQCLRAIFPFANYLRTDLDRIGQKHMFIAVYFHTCMYIYYIFTWFGGRRHLWVVQAKLLAGSPACLLLYVTACMHVHVFHQSCVYMHKLLMQACTQGSLASLTCHLDLVFFKEAIFVRRHMYLLVYSICVYVGICQEADVHPLCICMQSKKWLTFLRRFFLCLQLLCIRWLGLPTHCSSIYWHPYVR